MAEEVKFKELVQLDFIKNIQKSFTQALDFPTILLNREGDVVNVEGEDTIYCRRIKLKSPSICEKCSLSCIDKLLKEQNRNVTQCSEKVTRLIVKVKIFGSLVGYLILRGLIAEGTPHEVINRLEEETDMEVDISSKTKITSLIDMLSLISSTISSSAAFELISKEIEGKPSFKIEKGTITDAIESGLKRIDSLSKRLFDTEKKYHTLFERATDAIFIVDLASQNLIDVNSEAERLTGFAREELLKMKLEQLYHKDSKGPKHDSSAKTGRLGAPTEKIIKKKDGSLANVEVSSSIIRYGENKVLQSILRDVTKKRESEEKIAQEKQKLDQIVSAIGAGIALIDKNMKISWVNQIMRNWLFEYDSYDKFCYEILWKRKEPCNNCPLLSLAKSSKTLQEERIAYLSGEEKKYYLQTAAPISDKEGEVFQTLELVQDITDRKALEDQFMQSAKMAAVGQLASGIAHEINNPLASILLHSNLVMEAITKKDEIFSDLKRIESDAMRCKGIIDNLLDFSRKTEMVKEEIDINDLLEKTLTLVHYEKVLKEIKINRHYHENIPNILGDEKQLQQVIINLIINAFQAMPEGGEIDITTKYKRRAKNVEISIKDSGPGIPRRFHEKIFEPFFTNKDEGTGLGLSICFRIIERHSGTIEVESESKEDYPKIERDKIETGTTFIIKLPTMKLC